jgi:ABC-type Mn2+/Zn2+ transport system ATPase subunit
MPLTKKQHAEENRLPHSLTASKNGEVIFTHDGKWLYPLFALEKYLRVEKIDGSGIHLHDTVAGRAAASLMVRFGIRSCHIGILSEHGLAVFRAHGVKATWDSLVPKILCRTEDLLTHGMTLDSMYRMLRSRARLVDGIPISVRGLCSGYPGKEVCSSLDLELAAGENLIIRGGNGCGKTTFLRTLLGLVPVSSGGAAIGEYLVGSRKWKENRSCVAYVHQEEIAGDVPVSVREVVGIGLACARMNREEREFALEVAAKRTACFDLFQRNYYTLSGGEKQRVNLARCLAQKARVLLLDEPSSALDKAGKEVLRDLLLDLSLNEMPTVILVTHDDLWAQPLGWSVREMEGGRRAPRKLG